jgi:hypothetical protein
MTPTSCAEPGGPSVTTPIPFPNPTTGDEGKLAFQLNAPARWVMLKVYTVDYRLILRKTYRGPFQIGWTILPMKLEDQKGALLANGIYYLVVELPNGDRAIGTLAHLK